MNLWHYTCRHSMLVLGTGRAELQPAWDLYDDAGRTALPSEHRPIAELVWLTDLETPVAEALGLTRNLVRCDRTGYRYRVDDDRAPILRYVSVRRNLPPYARRALETAPGAMPMHWWVSSKPVSVVFDPVPVMAS